jgi:hypothetical protein
MFYSMLMESSTCMSLVCAETKKPDNNNQAAVCTMNRQLLHDLSRKMFSRWSIQLPNLIIYLCLILMFIYYRQKSVLYIL